MSFNVDQLSFINIPSPAEKKKALVIIAAFCFVFVVTFFRKRSWLSPLADDLFAVARVIAEEHQSCHHQIASRTAKSRQHDKQTHIDIRQTLFRIMAAKQQARHARASAKSVFHICHEAQQHDRQTQADVGKRLFRI